MNINALRIPFPDEIHGYIPGLTQKKGCNFIILIDNRITEDQQEAALRHELAHIALKHFDDTLPIDDAIQIGSFGDGWEEREKAADRLADQLSAERLLQLCI